MSVAPPRVLAILGPTASGKSAIAHLVADALGGEIVVADPFQRYRGLEVAADTPDSAARSQIVHHLVGDLALSERSSAAEFARRAHSAIDGVLADGRVPLVSGGSGLYVRAALCRLDFPPEPDPEIRRHAERMVADDLPGAFAELMRLDAARAEVIDRRNPRRVARALALSLAGASPQGEPADGRALWTATTRHPTLSVALERPRAELDRRIHARVLRELEDGLVAELESALDTPDLAREPAQIIGMREVTALRAGDLELGDLPARLAARTRRLARAQMTWLRKSPGLHWLEAGDASEAALAERVLNLWRLSQGETHAP